MSRYLDAQDVPIGLAAFLAYDDYDHINEPNHISATSLIKPIRQLVLNKRLSPEQRVDSLFKRVKSRMGQAMHVAIEDVWLNHRTEALTALGVPEHKQKLVVVNPIEGENLEGKIVVYMEKRSFKEVGPYVVSGKFDFIFDGQLQDFKFTSTFTYKNQTKAEDYIAQGSLYRWLNPELVTKAHMAINYTFWDWMAGKANMPDYPPKPMLQQIFPLDSVETTQRFVENKVREIARYTQEDDKNIPLCSDKDLWRTDVTYKYYADPTKTDGRSTRNFDDYNEAVTFQLSKGGKGVILKHKPEPKACAYCMANSICGQYKGFVEQGIIKP